MSVVTQQIPTGTWKVDPIHSSVTFAVRHMVVSTFRGGFDEYDITLDVPEDGAPTLAGSVEVSSVNVKLEDLKGHLQAPDFFDAERHPQLLFSSKEIRIAEDGELVVDGELTIKGQTRPVESRGSYTHIEADIAGGERIGLELETVVDRTAFGLDWNAELPKGGFALDNDVKLVVALELTKAE